MFSSLSPLVVGNWKMHGSSGSLAEALAIAQALAREPAAAHVALCPPATLIERMSRALAGTPVAVGAQDIHAESRGPYTGDVCGEMLVDAGASLVVIGHSERRSGHCETDADVAGKVRAACAAGLFPIVCVGETLEQRRAGLAETAVTTQAVESLPEVLRDCPFAVAYEPIWAIGSGATPSPAEIEEVHRAIRAALAERLGEAGRTAPILYGGSVTPGNAAEILRTPEVGGALVGGASLKAETFLPIVRAAGARPAPSAAAEAGKGAVSGPL
jgi:triosephosphate isomerase